jgi:L-rhamnose mutarotase
MARAAFYMRLRAGARRQYIEAHAPENIWPSIVEACRRAGIRNYSIWIGGRDGLDVFASFESDDVAATMAALAADPANKPWQAHIEPLMEVTGSFEAGGMTMMTEVFHLD